MVLDNEIKEYISNNVTNTALFCIEHSINAYNRDHWTGGTRLEETYYSELDEPFFDKLRQVYYSDYVELWDCVKAYLENKEKLQFKIKTSILKEDLDIL